MVWVVWLLLFGLVLGPWRGVYVCERAGEGEGLSHAPVPQLWSRARGGHLPGARALALQARSAWEAAGWASSGTPGEVWKVWSWEP